MKYIRYILPLAVIFLISSCATNKYVASDYERYVDLSVYKSYKILKHKPGFPIGTNPINTQRIERAIDREMGYLGFTQMDEEPDLIVSFFVKERTVREVYHYRNFYRRWNHPIWIAVDEYSIGTLVVDLIDRETEQVVWHGATSTNRFDDLRIPQEEVYDSVRAIFNRFEKDMHNYRPISFN